MPFVHLDLTNGTAYYYRVSAANPGGEGPLSAEVRATPMLPFTKILTKLTDPDAEEMDQFGVSVSISGDYAIVGASRSSGLDPNNPVPNAGAAYVFHRTNGIWDPAGTKLMAFDAEAYDRFGISVSISGEYAIVGAKMEDGGPGGPYPNAGAAYIFRLTGPNTWEAGPKLMSPDPQSNGMFGYAVSISGDYALVGSPGEDRVFVFYRTGINVWDNVSMLWVPDSEAGDYFGTAVAMSGDYAIIGAYGEDGGPDNPRTDVGAAYIFHRTDVNAWDLVSKIMPHDGEAGDYFGYSVAISGDYAVVGAYGKDGGGDSPIPDAGAAYVFHRLDENFWDEGPKIVAHDAQGGDYFGWSVAITDHYVLVGAYAENCGWDENSAEGSAYVFERLGANTWDIGTKITIPLGDAGDRFGYSVAISGESAIIGAIGDDCDTNETPEAGAVYLY